MRLPQSSYVIKTESIRQQNSALCWMSLQNTSEKSAHPFPRELCCHEVGAASCPNKMTAEMASANDWFPSCVHFWSKNSLHASRCTSQNGCNNCLERDLMASNGAVVIWSPAIISFENQYLEKSHRSLIDHIFYVYLILYRHYTYIMILSAMIKIHTV